MVLKLTFQLLLAVIEFNSILVVPSMLTVITQDVRQHLFQMLHYLVTIVILEVLYLLQVHILERLQLKTTQIYLRSQLKSFHLAQLHLILT